MFVCRSDEGLTLETSASESLYGGQFTLSTQLIKPNYLVILPPTQHHSFFRNLPPLFICHFVCLFVCLSVCFLSVCQSVSWSVCLSFCLSVYLFLCLILTCLLSFSVLSSVPVMISKLFYCHFLSHNYITRISLSDNLSVRRAQQKANLMCKCVNKLAPDYLCNMFTPRTSSFDLRDASQKLYLPKPRPDVYLFSIIVILIFLPCF